MELLRPEQIKALNNMDYGKILCGNVGSGKSRTGLAFYFQSCGGKVEDTGVYKMTHPLDLIIITTAKKRDDGEWESEMNPFGMSYKHPELSNYKDISIKVDSWNNLPKYKDVKNAFFILDEQRLVGYGTWAKSFIEIAKHNKWIMLSATPGDDWMDYLAVFIANGFYRNKTDFITQHVVFDHRVKFPRVARWLNTGRLIRLRDKILVDMTVDRVQVPHHLDIQVGYDEKLYLYAFKNRWDPYKNEPYENASSFCYGLRKIVNSSNDRLLKTLQIAEERNKVIIFYNFDYERELLLKIFNLTDFEVAEWSGHAHQPLPDGNKWVYLVQYTAGCEGWNCITTNTIIFYSQDYSYKHMIQAAGRIDRLNSPFIDLYYYHLRSKASIDISINRAIKTKKKFNEGRFANKFFEKKEKTKDEIDIDEIVQPLKDISVNKE